MPFLPYLGEKLAMVQIITSTNSNTRLQFLVDNVTEVMCNWQCTDSPHRL